MKNRRKNLIPRAAILDLGDYERKRDEIRPRAIAARAARRIELGPNATIAFENRETVTYQIQEMLRAERIARDVEVQHEIETYSDLLPSSDELSATVMFEFGDPDARAVHLHDLVGFEDHLRIDFEGAGSSKAYFDRRQLDDERISAVQFVRFPLTDAQRRAIERGGRVRIAADHPKYRHAADLTPQTSAALAADLAEAEADG
ncbi:MAG TPA: DUF3501 family protein [Thermoanaerobaculia bacterium]|nr:DUF3501 family protein [Thermoanaerobaculia bacterium]